MASSTTSVQKKKDDDFDLGAIVVSGAKHVVTKNPVKVSVWVLGLLLAAFATGFTVDKVTAESYELTLKHADDVTRSELLESYSNLQKAEQRHYQLKGWFWSCDGKCQKALDKVNMARDEVDRIEKKRQQLITEARQEVGIWSTFGVQDVRNGFWSAWKSGKDMASRWTMMDAMFMMFGGKEETLVEVLLKLLFQYIVNLTLGLVGAFFYFVYNVYVLIVSYGEPALSGIAFFLLVLVAGMATIGTYLFAIYGTVVGGGAYMVKKAVDQAKLEGQRGAAPRRVQYGNYGSGRPGGFRNHYD